MPLRGDSSLDCKEARELTRAFLSSGGLAERRAEWRAHLAACKECDEQYRDTVEMLSRLHRARRDGPSVADEPEPEAPSARRSLIAFSPPRTRVAWRPRKRAGWLALAIPFAALLVFGAIGLPGEGPRAANVLALHGAVGVGKLILAPGDPACALERGSMIVAEAAARARLQDAQSEIVFEGEGMLRCEGFAPLRVHLYGGRLELHNECKVSTAVGIVECPGGVVEVHLREDGLHIRAGGLGARFRDGSGLREIAAGAELAIATPAVPAAGH